MKSNQGQPAESDEVAARSGRDLLDVHGLAARLGVGERHVRRLVAERRIPYIKWGHLLRFDPRDVDEWVDAQRVAAHLSRRDVAAGRL